MQHLYLLPSLAPLAKSIVGANENQLKNTAGSIGRSWEETQASGWISKENLHLFYLNILMSTPGDLESAKNLS